MKKTLSIILIASLIFTMTSCGGKKVVTSSSSLATENNDIVASGSNQSSSTSGASSIGSTSKASTSGKASTSSSSKATSSPAVTNVEMANSVNVKAGTTPMESGLNFGGKTFRMAITEEPQYHTTSFTRLVSAFSAKYNCKITTEKLVFANYNQQIQAALSGQKPYDIAFMHGSMFPVAPISNLYNDLSSYITTADLVKTSNIAAGGIDINKSSYFVWQQKLVGVCAYADVYPYVIYYNKALFKTNGLEDPLELYNAKKWTWTKIKSMGQQVTQATNKTYFLSSDFRSWGTLHSVGTPLITIKNGAVVENFSSTGIVKGLTLIKSLFRGSTAIAEPFVASVGKYDSFYNGTVFMTMEESSKFSEIASTAVTKIAFARSKANIGIVPVPLDSTNTTKAYPTGWLSATCSGKGSADPRVAVAFAKFRSSYSDPVVGANEMSADQKALTSKLLLSNLCFGHGGYFDSVPEHSTVYLGMELPSLISTGSDISQTINNIRPLVQASIKATIG